MTEDALRGKRVLLTGAGGGIGRVIATELSRHGASLGLIGRRRGPLEAVMAALPPNGVAAHTVHVIDVASEPQWLDERDRLAANGKVDGLVLAAGILGPVGRVGTWTADQFRAAIDTNLTGTVTPIVVLLEHLAAARGSVVTFSGGGATSPLSRYDAYAASKAAVVRLTENMADDLAERGVRINSIAPGFVVTSIHQGTLDAGADAAGAEYFARTARAMREGVGDPPELAARLSAFLLSESANGITGRLISARWDPWETEEFRARLRTEPDLATLRRIDDQFFRVVAK
jgi:NAD(P)-dependent dehydrogenase (short-subunit alcohol dehydrogenase family)